MAADTVAPVTTSNAIESYVDSATVILTPTDAGSGVASTKWRLNGGTWTTGKVVSAIPVGSHVVEWYSTDLEGNVEAVKTASLTVFRQYEQTDTQLAWSGAWTTLSDANNYTGGSIARTNVAGASMSIVFEGTGLDLISYKNPFWGIGSVSVDGGSPVDVDFYSPGYKTKTKIWGVSGLSDTTHTVTFEWTGRKNAASAGTHIAVDRIDVIGSLKQAADTVPPTTTSNALASYAGSATITLTPVDTASGVASTQWRLDGSAWTSGTVASCNTIGSHLLEWYSVDSKGNTEQTKTASFTVLNQYEQDHPDFAWVGAWSTLSDANNYSSGTLARTNSAGAGFSASFTGTAFDLISYKNPYWGIAQVQLDGGTPVDIDLYDPKFLAKNKVWSVTGLENTSHTVSVTWTGRKNPASLGTHVAVDRVDIVGTLTR